jgi:probable rRNA maturation factor
MNIVNLSTEDIPVPRYSKKIILFAEKILDFIRKKNWNLSIVLCGNSKIKKLNYKYRGINQATDVLSFELGIKGMDFDGKIRHFAGDIFISLEKMEKNALQYKISEDEELRRLIIHGILHLDGFDHETNNSDEAMLVKQEKILEKFKEDHILPKENKKDKMQKIVKK